MLLYLLIKKDGNTYLNFNISNCKHNAIFQEKKIIGIKTGPDLTGIYYILMQYFY